MALSYLPLYYLLAALGLGLPLRTCTATEHRWQEEQVGDPRSETGAAGAALFRVEAAQPPWGQGGV